MSKDDAPLTRHKVARHRSNTFGTDLARAFRVPPTSCLASLQDGLVVASTRLRRSEADPRPTEPLVRTPDVLALVSLGPVPRLSVDLGPKTPVACHPGDQGGFLLADLSYRPAFLCDGPIDLVAVLLPRGFLAKLAGRRTFALKDGQPVVAPEAPDATMLHLAESLADGFIDPSTVSAPLVDSILLAIGVHVSQAYGAGTIPRRVSGGMTESTLKRAKDRLHSNLSANATLRQIAADLGMSEGHFARTFKQSTGYSPHQWSMIQRCELAKTLLRSGAHTIAQVAMMAGFADQAHFSRSFRMIVGVTPRQWREGVIGKTR